MAWCMGGADDGADTANLSGTNLLAMLQQPQPLPPGPPPAMAGAHMLPGAHMQHVQHMQPPIESSGAGIIEGIMGMLGQCAQESGDNATQESRGSAPLQPHLHQQLQPHLQQVLQPHLLQPHLLAVPYHHMSPAQHQQQPGAAMSRDQGVRSDAGARSDQGGNLMALLLREAPVVAHSQPTMLMPYPQHRVPQVLPLAQPLRTSTGIGRGEGQGGIGQPIGQAFSPSAAAADAAAGNIMALLGQSPQHAQRERPVAEHDSGAVPQYHMPHHKMQLPPSQQHMPPSPPPQQHAAPPPSLNRITPQHR